jgi:hypothetical protein
MNLSLLAHTPYRRHHCMWNLHAFEPHDDASCKRAAKRAPHYPIRHLRYWFMDQIQQRALVICEIGVGSGALLTFVNRTAVGCDTATSPCWIAGRDGVSRRIDHSALETIGYNHCIA